MPVTALDVRASLRAPVPPSTPSSSNTGETKMLELEKVNGHRSTSHSPEVLAAAIVVGVVAQAALGPIAGLVGAGIGASLAGVMSMRRHSHPPTGISGSDSDHK